MLCFRFFQLKANMASIISLVKTGLVSNPQWMQCWLEDCMSHPDMYTGPVEGGRINLVVNIGVNSGTSRWTNSGANLGANSGTNNGTSSSGAHAVDRIDLLSGTLWLRELLASGRSLIRGSARKTGDIRTDAGMAINSSMTMIMITDTTLLRMRHTIKSAGAVPYRVSTSLKEVLGLSSQLYFSSNFRCNLHCVMLYMLYAL